MLLATLSLGPPSAPNPSPSTLAYAQEIAGRTEQFWCPIKHAVALRTRHSRHQDFLDYGDAEEYRKRVEQVRRDFLDLTKPEATPALGRKFPPSAGPT